MYRIAGIDVHKRILTLAMADAESGGEHDFVRHKVDATPNGIRGLAQWCVERDVQEVVMESTAQYWKPVWEALEQHWLPTRDQQGGNPVPRLHLAQAKSNRAPKGRKNDFADAERLVKRLVAQELTLSFVPGPEQRLWRTVTHRKHQLTRDKVRLQNQLESLLEEAHIKLSSIVSDLLGQSGRRILRALAEGETKPAALAELVDRGLRATPEQLCDALGAAAHLNPVYRQLIKMQMEQLKVIEEQMDQLDHVVAGLLKPHEDAVKRLAEVPGLGPDSAQQIVAEVGPKAATFPSAKRLSSWVGVCPGEEESAGVSTSSRSPKGNKTLRRILNQAAHAVVKVKGCIFEIAFQRLRRRMDYKEALWAIAHRICRLTWKLLHEGVRYEERGPAVSAKSEKTRAAKMIRQLRRMGYTIESPCPQPA